MATINITNGTATQNLAAGAYTATANVTAIVMQQLPLPTLL